MQSTRMLRIAGQYFSSNTFGLFGALRIKCLRSQPNGILVRGRAVFTC
jgi:hypothetical protein